MKTLTLEERFSQLEDVVRELPDEKRRRDLLADQAFQSLEEAALPPD